MEGWGFFFFFFGSQPTIFRWVEVTKKSLDFMMINRLCGVGIEEEEA